MSARGARSRKAVAKDIEKKEKKDAVKGKAPVPVRRPIDAFGASNTASGRDRGTGVPSRSYTISSDGSRNTSRSSPTNLTKSHLHRIPSIESTEFNRPYSRPPSASGTTISSNSSKDKEKNKYQTKGKETNAPRGRGGGVPVKSAAVRSPPPLIRPESSLSQVQSHVPSYQKTWINFRIWEGGEATMRPYGGWDYDEHMQHGNVLIYFKEEQHSEDRPVPQIRADLEVLENAGSTWLSNALLYGRLDDNDDEWTLPGTAMSPSSRHPPSFGADEAYFGVPSSRNVSRNQFYLNLSSNGSSPMSPPPPFNFPQPGPPTHELWFTAPAHVRTPQGQRLHHVAVRNFLAMLHNKPIVGADLFEMLSTLQPEIQVMYDLDYDDRSRMTPRERSVQMITQYLASHGLDDVRNSIKNALGLLSWAEQENVRWRQGYLEAFTHLAGMMTPQIEDLPEFKRLSIVTRRNLGLVAKTIQLQVMEAEEKLATFDFNDLWEGVAKAAESPVYQSFNAFRQFLINYYTNIYGAWPPTRGKTWLNRKVILQLQEDFGWLYDYLVNRDVIWDSREERPGKKWKIEHRAAPDDFRADYPELDLTDMLVTFDNRHGFLHIPHPYPLLPREVPSSGAKAPSKKGFFSSLKKPKNDVTKDAKAHLALSIVFSDATNVEKLDVSFNGSHLIDAFERFELNTDSKGATPREARLGRWVLLYGIQQVLSKLSVDIHGLKYTDGVRYLLCPDLKRLPDWVSNGQTEEIEASQLRSWCWQRSWDESRIQKSPVELEGSSIPKGNEIKTPPPPPTEGQLEQDIHRISEKIDNMSGLRGDTPPTSAPTPTPPPLTTTTTHPYERRLIENEKLMREDFAKAKRMDTSNDFARMSEGVYNRPLVPVRSPRRSPPSLTPPALTPRGQYFGDEKAGWAG